MAMQRCRQPLHSSHIDVQGVLAWKRHRHAAWEGDLEADKLVCSTKIKA